MKKLLSLFSALAILLCTSCAIAVDGVYVPSFDSFMETFSSKLNDINRDLGEALYEECLVDGEWNEPSTNYSYLSCYDVSTRLRIREGNGFLESVKVELSKNRLDKEEALFKEVVLAAATSIIHNADESFEQSFFNNIYYDYVMESPAGYISMYWNCGVYLFNFIKMSDEITVEISLSVYEVEP